MNLNWEVLITYYIPLNAFMLSIPHIVTLKLIKKYQELIQMELDLIIDEYLYPSMETFIWNINMKLGSRLL